MLLAWAISHLECLQKAETNQSDSHPTLSECAPKQPMAAHQPRQQERGGRERGGNIRKGQALGAKKAICQRRRSKQTTMRGRRRRRQGDGAGICGSSIVMR
jgi:hypothetical protein